MDEADRHGLYAGGPQRFRGLDNLLPEQRPKNVPLFGQAFSYFKAQLPWRRRNRLEHVEIVETRTFLTRELENVPEARRREHSGPIGRASCRERECQYV